MERELNAIANYLKKVENKFAAAVSAVSYANESSLSPHGLLGVFKSAARRSPGCPFRCAHYFGQDAMISIIDDDASVRASTYRLVRSLGYIAATFASAGEFLRSPQLDHTSCVIADIQMPGMSGIELQNLLQTQGRKLPMIFITAFPEERVRAQALKSGAACVLSKPFNARTLIEYLDAVMKSRIEDGRIVEVWALLDSMSFMQQLGVIPGP